MISQVIIYGAGKRGRKYYEFLKQKNLTGHIYGFCDKNHEQIGFVDDKKVYCYDAMVHFELMDIYEYLKDMYRVLAPGGRVLIHHSNQTGDCKCLCGKEFHEL